MIFIESKCLFNILTFEFSISPSSEISTQTKPALEVRSQKNCVKVDKPTTNELLSFWHKSA